MNMNRQPAGSVGGEGKGTGGRFAATLFARGADALDAREWTQPSGAERGGRSPWGDIESVECVSTGINFVMTAGHGGYKLSRERNAAMPPEFRRSGGWYEEDQDRFLCEMFFADDMGCDDERKADLVASVKDWFPDEYESVTGETIPPGESYTRDKDRFSHEHANDLVAFAVLQRKDGVVRVQACRGGLGADYDATYIYHIPAEEYDDKARFGFVIDESRYEPVKIIENGTQKGILQ